MRGSRRLRGGITPGAYGRGRRRSSDQLFRATRVEWIEPIEHGRPPSIIGIALGERAARGRAVALIRAAGLESTAATRARSAAKKRAHAFWDGIDGFLRQRGGGRQRHAHAATT